VNIDEPEKTKIIIKASSVANISYMSFDLGHMIRTSTPRASLILNHAMEMILKKRITQVSPVNVFPFAEIIAAFTTVHEKVSSRVMLKATENDLVPTVPRDEHPLKLDPNATYILVGGLGGLGRSLSGILVEHGARHLAFFSRSGAVSGEQQQVLEGLQQKGVEAKVYTCDICEEPQLAVAILKCKQEMPDIRGLIHGAAVIRVRINPHIFKLGSYATLGLFQNLINL
jgi:hypothetical protein